MTSGRRFARAVGEVLAAAILAVGLVVAQPGLATAHTGDDATFNHVFVEFALWGAGLAAAITLLVAVFWIRARLLRRSE